MKKILKRIFNLCSETGCYSFRFFGQPYCLQHSLDHAERLEDIRKELNNG